MNKRHKVWRKKALEIKNESEDQGKSSPKSIGTLTVLRCITDFPWWWLVTQTSSKWGKFLLLSSLWPWRFRSIDPQNNRDLHQGVYISGPNLVILAETVDKLSPDKLVIDGTQTHTHAGNDNTQRPKPTSGNENKHWRWTWHIKCLKSLVTFPKKFSIRGLGYAS